ncbi:Serine protease V8 [Phytophthora palmivora]|uniref:Serine protease V8 n=1 Tax=Phytophthora palmivora TaxID=4796 RepID=A0A2P4Y412_9STRA|nr:Serine protease V8 [Phytophthora palmivora]
MKTDNGWGTVTSLSVNGCAREQVAYMLDTQGGSSGSPVLGWSDNAVVALHHCGGCPNTAINSNKLVTDMKTRNILPNNAVSEAATSSPTTSPPTQAPTTAPAPIIKTKVDGTIKSTATFTSVDYVDFSVSSEAAVELDILSMEQKAGGGYVDVNEDCNAGYLDSGIVLFSVNTATGAMTALAANDNAPTGYGAADRSISSADSYLYVKLSAGTYRLAVSGSGLTPAQAANKQMPLSSNVRVCDKGTSNYGNYRLTISTTATVKAISPGSYIGTQCNVVSPNIPYSQCPYHREAALAYATGVEGSIVRSRSTVSVDYIPFTVPVFNRITVEVASYGSADGTNFVDVNGNCESAYIDPVAYLFRANSAGLSAADLVNSGDDDDNFMKRTHYRSITFRDPYLSLALPAGDYILVVGRYPLSLEDAIARSSSTSVDKLTPESCGKESNRGNYLAILSSADKLSITSPRSFSGTRCPSDVGKQVCTA